MLPLIKIGDRGEWVTYCQNLLNARLFGAKAMWVDGDFGVTTDVAVRQFQAQRFLTVDGKVGDKTWSALEVGPPAIKRRPRSQVVIETQGGGI
jgi:peptidoglycan hydrolase-like protein with peptidoglycan-binding domain